MKSAFRKIGKVFLWLAGIFFGLILFAIIAYSIIYSPQYVMRALMWGNSDVYDYKKFPERVMEPGSEVFFFNEQPDEDYINSVFNSQVMYEEIDSFLDNPDTQALIIIQDDTILYEKYANGHDRASIVTSFSTAKSFGSVLIGIAIDEGHIQSVDDAITNYIPELAERDADFKNITIKDLLKMSSGIEYREFPFLNGDNTLTYYHPDLRELAVNETRILDRPGQYFLYNNFHPLLLGIILERATGQPVAEFLEEKIWQKIGMEFEGSWSLDENGFEKMESGINARAIDFAKFGRLFLNNGRWGDVQVIPEDWIAESILDERAKEEAGYYESSFGPELIEIANGGYYQYMWYGLAREDGPNDFFAAGNHGQYIYISPQADMIIVRNGESYGPGLKYFDWIEFFYNLATMSIE